MLSRIRAQGYATQKALAEAIERDPVATLRSLIRMVVSLVTFQFRLRKSIDMLIQIRASSLGTHILGLCFLRLLGRRQLQLAWLVGQTFCFGKMMN